MKTREFDTKTKAREWGDYITEQMQHTLNGNSPTIRAMIRQASEMAYAMGAYDYEQFMKGKNEKNSNNKI